MHFAEHIKDGGGVRNMDNKVDINKAYRGTMVLIITVSIFIMLFLPFMNILGNSISLAKIISAMFGNTSNELVNFIRDRFMEQEEAYAIFPILLVIFAYPICMIGMVISPRRALDSYYTTLGAEILQFIIVLIVYRYIRTELTNSGSGSGLVSYVISMNTSTMVLWILCHIAVCIISIMGIYHWKAFQTENIDLEDESNNYYARENEEVQKIENFEGAIKGLNGLYRKKIYPLHDRWQIYFTRDSSGNIFLKNENAEAVGGIYYIQKYKEYCIEVYQNNVCFLKSGQPLGKNKRYYLPRGTEIFLDNGRNHFLLA